MTPEIITTFIINLLQANIKDTFTYLDYAWGNITGKFGSTTFYQNTNFDADADIVIVPGTAYTDNKSIDLPVDSDDNIKQGSYEFTYTVKKEGSLKVYPESGFTTASAPGSDTFTQLTISPAVTNLPAILAAFVTQYGSLQVKFYDADDNYLGTARDVTASSTTLILFDEVTIADYALISSVPFYVPQTYAKTFTYTFCDETPVSNLCVTHNCYTSQLSVIDNTTYPATQTVNSRLITIQYPRLANGTPVSETVTSATVSKTIGPNIWSGNYTVTNEVEVEWETTDDLVVQNTITTQLEHLVECDSSLCNLFNCINSLRAAYQSAIQNGSRYLSQLTTINFQVLLFVQSYKIAVECQQTAVADQLISDLTLYLGANSNTMTAAGCSCGCGCGDSGSSNSGVPAIIYPLYSTPDTSQYVPITRTINGHELDEDIVLNKTDIGLGNVPNVDATNPANINQTPNYRFVTDTEKGTWNGKQDALGFTPENVANKKTAMSGNEASNVFYLTAKAIYDWATATFQAALGYTAENVANKQVTLTSSTTEYPACKAVKDVTDLLAPLASPTFTGNPAAPTQVQGDNSTKIATTAYVDTGLATKQGELLGTRFTSGPVAENLGIQIYRLNTALGAINFGAVTNNTTARIVYIINEDGANTIDVSSAGFTFNGSATITIAATPRETLMVIFDGTSQTDIVCKVL